MNGPGFGCQEKPKSKPGYFADHFTKLDMHWLLGGKQGDPAQQKVGSCESESASFESLIKINMSVERRLPKHAIDSKAEKGCA